MGSTCSDCLRRCLIFSASSELFTIPLHLLVFPYFDSIQHSSDSTAVTVIHVVLLAFLCAALAFITSFLEF